MKRLLAIIIVLAIITATAVTALAGSHRARYTKANAYPACVAEDCDIYGYHQHNGEYCFGYAQGGAGYGGCCRSAR